MNIIYIYIYVYTGNAFKNTKVINNIAFFINVSSKCQLNITI